MRKYEATSKDWWHERQRKLNYFIYNADADGDDSLYMFLQELKDTECGKCHYWEDECYYDSGNVGTCKHPKIYGEHHPSNGCQKVEQTLVAVIGLNHQELQTRHNFGCNLYEKKQ